jgi:hypothetical protein
VREAGEDARLARETLDARCAGKPGIEDLDRDTLIELPVAAFGEPHGAHAALADRLDEAVRADITSCERDRWRRG